MLGRSTRNPTTGRQASVPLRRIAHPHRHSLLCIPTLGLFALVVAVILGIALTGCSAGHITQASSRTPAVDGTFAQTGSIVVLNARFPYPESGRYSIGATAPLLLTIVNEGTMSDRLTSVSSPIGSPVMSGRTDIPAGYSITAKPLLIGSSSPGAASNTSLTDPPRDGSAPLRASGPPVLAVGAIHILLTDLAQPIKPGLTYPVTLVFANAGPVTLQVPINNAEPLTATWRVM